jgi:hypothetical protein
MSSKRRLAVLNANVAWVRTSQNTSISFVSAQLERAHKVALLNNRRRFRVGILALAIVGHIHGGGNGRVRADTEEGVRSHNDCGERR